MSGVYKTGNDLNTFNIAAVSFLSDLKEYTLKLENTEIDASVLTQYAQRSQPGMSALTLDFTTLSAIGAGSSCATKVSGLQLSAFGIGGTSILSSFKSLNFDLSTDQDEISAAADLFKSHQNVGYTISADAEVMVASASAHTWFTQFNATGANKYLTFTMTLNGTTITVPMSVMSIDYMSKGKAVTTLKMSLKGFPACTGVFPTLPTSATDVLTGFLVDPISAVNFELKTQSSNGEIVDVNMVLKSLKFGVEKNAVTEVQYSLISTGNPANAIS